MKGRKYIFHPDLKPYEKLKAVLNPLLGRVLQTLMGVQYGMEKDDDGVSVTQYRIPATDGANIRLLFYAPKQCAERMPCLFFLHGGGFVFNAAPHHFALARRFTKELQVKTVFVDYRLAPKYKFPTAQNDCLSAYRWVISNAEKLGVDAEKMLVCGDSAGGNLATVLCLMAKDAGLTLPKAQMLLYSFVDRRMNTESYLRYTDTPMCNSKDMEKYLKMYVKNLEATQIPYLSPIEGSLVGMPPAYIEVAQYDCLRDEGVKYSEALEQCGVYAELHEIKAAMHGYDIAKDSGLLNEIMEVRLRFFQKILNS